jgi:hypothetical protein
MRGSGVYSKADSLATRALMVLRERFPHMTLRSRFEDLDVDAFDLALLAAEFEQATGETTDLAAVCAAETVLAFVEACSAAPVQQDARGVRTA